MSILAAAPRRPTNGAGFFRTPLLGLLALGLAGGPGRAADGLRLAGLFNDHMVLQCDRPLPVWGWAQPGETVTVSFAGQTKAASAAADGRWWATLDPLPAAAEPRDLRVTGRQEVVCRNVVVGEVWLCAGQSNMEMLVDCVRNSPQEREAAEDPQLRLFNVVRDWDRTPQTEVKGYWAPCSPRNVGGWSAAAYFFGRELRRRRSSVPVGLITAYWGGTPAQTWTPLPALQADPRYAVYLEQYAGAAGLDKAAFLSWEKESIEASYNQDPGNAGEKQGWPAPEADLKDWFAADPSLNFDADKHIGNIDGAVWYRRAVTLPAAWAGAALTLEVGTVDDSSVVYFNGQRLGERTRQGNVYRSVNWLSGGKYAVPAKLVQAGRNVIAIRVFDLKGNGGMNPATLALVKAGEPPLSLRGDWYARIELSLPPRERTPCPFKLSQPKGLEVWGAPYMYPSYLYNAMIAPAVPYALRGAIWYQGESNARRAAEYRHLFPALITAWRQAWGQGDFPFYFVQLPNYVDPNWPTLREAQRLTLALPNTGMAIAIDLGEAHQIHPANKQDVGKRLALLALRRLYGQPGEDSGPLYEAHKPAGSSLRLSFTHLGGGLVCRGDSLKGFEICGADGKFVPAQARLAGDEVVVESPAVPEPTGARYSWASLPDGNLYNQAGLPAAPFCSRPVFPAD